MDSSSGKEKCEGGGGRNWYTSHQRRHPGVAIGISGFLVSHVQLYPSWLLVKPEARKRTFYKDHVFMSSLKYFGMGTTKKCIRK
jgi:hypothetical protein